MQCIVTAGPTYEPLDKVRRLTNFSTGKLGTLLAKQLANRGHHVRLLVGSSATFHAEPETETREMFTTTEDLRARLQPRTGEKIDAIYHAAAVSDFRFGRVFDQQPDGTLREVKSGKISTRQGRLLAELQPTPKIISELRGWYATAFLVGWKYEVEGDRASAVANAQEQIRASGINTSVANGPAYGFGFGVVKDGGANEHFSDLNQLFERLEMMALAAIT